MGNPLIREDRDYNLSDKVKLTQDQNDGVEFLLTHFNSILGLKAGSGKTLALLTAIKHILNHQDNVIAIVLCPKPATTIFVKEAKEKLDMSMTVYTTEIQSTTKGAKTFLFNYSRLDKLEPLLDECDKKGLKVVLACDEVHKLMSKDSNLSVTLRKLRPRFTCVYGATATPLLGDIEGLFYVVDFVRPGYLGTISQFKNAYIDYKKKSIRIKGRSRQIFEIVGYRNLDILREKLKQICIVRGKKYNLEYHFHHTTLTEPEQVAYKEAADGIIAEGYDTDNEKSFGPRLHDLQRVADGSYVKDLKFVPAKIKLLVNLCKKLVSTGDSILIYTEYEDSYEFIKRYLERYKIEIGYRKLFMVTGKIPDKKRREVETDMRDKDITIITKAGCFAKGTRVIMADGSLKNVEEIKIGDYVLGRGSIPRKVIELHRGVDTMFCIKQKGAEDYVVNSKHILTLKYAYERSEFGFHKGDILNITVEDFLKKSRNFQSHFRGFKEGYEGERSDLCIDPYMLGLWLGDGDKYHSALYVSDLELELANQWISYGESLGLDCRIEQGNLMGGKAKKYILTSHTNGKSNKFTRGLRDLGILANKRIPECYFRASREQRLALFAGIINTDGYVHRESLCVSSAIKELAEDYKRLGDSLGYRTRLTTRVGGGFKKDSVQYLVTFVGNFKDVVLLMNKKRPKVRRDFKRYNWSTISVEELGQNEFYGFTIEGDDKLFMLEDGTVVHNCESINLQRANHVILYNVPFALGTTIQCIGRITRIDTKKPVQHIHIVEAEDTVDTYKRMLLQEHQDLIGEIFGPEPNLPQVASLEHDDIVKLKQYMKNKFLWKRF